MNGSRTIVPSAAYTAAPTIPNFKNPKAKGVKLTIDITAISGGQTVTVTILGVDPVSGKTYTILASAALAAVATTVLKVYPGLTPAANLAVNDVLDGDWTVSVVLGNGVAVTFSVGANLII